MGRPQNAAKEEETSGKVEEPKQEESHPDWQDPELLEDIEVCIFYTAILRLYLF